MAGKLIFLFGIDGSGKTTIIKMLEDSDLKNTVCASSLTGSVFEDELYNAELKLKFVHSEFFSREFKHVLHINSVIHKMFNMVLPILDSGRNVILDRYIICIRLYSNLFLSPSFNCILKTLECLPIPDLGIHFDINIGTAIHRLKKRSCETGIPPHFSESKKSLMLKRKGYETLIPNEEYTILKVDAAQQINNVYAEVLKIIKMHVGYL